MDYRMTIFCGEAPKMRISYKLLVPSAVACALPVLLGAAGAVRTVSVSEGANVNVTLSPDQLAHKILHQHP
jgi:hypothetical protein